MASSEKPESLRVMPVTGKYCEIIYDNKAYQIWKVNPGTPNTYGSLVPYDAAVYFLGKTPPVITLVPVVKNGKYVSSILPEDQEKIKESLARGSVGNFKNYNQQAKDSITTNTGDASVELKNAMSLLEAQVKKNTVLESQLSDLMGRMKHLEALKSGGGGGGSATIVRDADGVGVGRVGGGGASGGVNPGSGGGGNGVGA